MPYSKQPIVVLLFAMILFATTQVSCRQASAEEVEAQWESSAHADKEARSFTRWNDENPAEIPANCAKCHSTTGYHSFLGVDGSTAGEVNSPVPVGTTIECEACHNDIAEQKQRVVMPSGLKIEHLGLESNCMECHQGRASAVQLSEAIARREQDTVDTELRMPNIHNNPVGATYYGVEARGGGEYDNQTYQEKFQHRFDSCITCHDPHNLQVNVQKCSACHLGATTIDGVRQIRLTNVDYDGDGDIREGLSGEIETMQQRLLAAIKLYALATEGVDAIEYNGRFTTQEGENYTTWTPRLMQAAYNYQYVDQDPGVYSHNAKYALQLLYDSMADLGLPTEGMTRP